MGYVTTEKFLTVFNLESLDDLPVPEDLEFSAERLFDPNVMEPKEDLSGDVQ